MRRATVLMFLLQLSSNAIAETEDWGELASKTNTLVWECAQKQMIHALEAGASDKAFGQLLSLMRKDRMQLFAVTTYNTALSTGRSDEEAQAFAKKLLQQSIVDMLRTYSNFRRKRENKIR